MYMCVQTFAKCHIQCSHKCHYTHTILNTHTHTHSHNTQYSTHTHTHTHSHNTQYSTHTHTHTLTQYTILNTHTHTHTLTQYTILNTHTHSHTHTIHNTQHTHTHTLTQYSTHTRTCICTFSISHNSTKYSILTTYIYLEYLNLMEFYSHTYNVHCIHTCIQYALTMM